jgi:sporulation protein YlmC with PRC-barrel domain
VDENELRKLIGYNVVDEQGKSIGNIEFVFNDDDTGQAEWIGLVSGTFRRRHLLVPATGAALDGVSLRVPWPKQRIEEAPTYGQSDHRGILGLGEYKTAISEEKERLACAHYGLERSMEGT